MKQFIFITNLVLAFVALILIFIKFAFDTNEQANVVFLMFLGAYQVLSSFVLTIFSIIKNKSNPTKAMAELAYQKMKADKKRQQDQMTVLQQQDAMAEKAFQRQLAIDNNKGKWQVAVKKMEATGFSDAAAFNAKASITKEQMQQEGEDKRLATKTINEIDLQNEKYNKEAQKPVV